MIAVAPRPWWHDLLWWVPLAWLQRGRATLVKYIGLESVYLARKHLAVPASGDPRVREEAGELPGLWWLVRAYGEVETTWRGFGDGVRPARARFRVWLLPHARPQVIERWVNVREDALAWVALAALEPAWAVMSVDGDDPWPLLRAVPEEELLGVLEAMGVEARVAGLVMERHVVRREVG